MHMHSVGTIVGMATLPRAERDEFLEQLPHMLDAMRDLLGRLDDLAQDFYNDLPWYKRLTTNPRKIAHQLLQSAVARCYWQCSGGMHAGMPESDRTIN